MENAPFELTRETIKHYGFSREDVKLLRDCIASNNRRIIDELREEYERLKAIEFDLGLDFSVLSNRINLTADFYHRLSD